MADMRDAMAYWNRPGADKFSRVQDKLDKLQDTMKKNIEMVMPAFHIIHPVHPVALV